MRVRQLMAKSRRWRDGAKGSWCNCGDGVSTMFLMGEHSFKLLALIDPAKVMDVSPWAKRFVEAMTTKMGA